MRLIHVDVDSICWLASPLPFSLRSEDQVPRVTKALLDFQCLRGLSSSSLEVRSAKHSATTSRVASGCEGRFWPHEKRVLSLVT